MPQLPTFRIKTLNFTRIIHLNWLAKIKLRSPGPPGSILLLGGISIGDHLNIIVGDPLKLFGKNYIEGALGPSINVIAGDPFKLGSI